MSDTKTTDQNILAVSLNGQLRLRALNKKRTSAVIELYSPGRGASDWLYCGFRSLPIEEARQIWAAQVKNHS